MPDREKVIKGLEVCTSKPCYCTDCPYKANCCLDSQEVMEDALALLKEQKAEITKMNKLEELRNTIQEMHDNNSDKPDVVTTMQFLLNLMEVKDGR